MLALWLTARQLTAMRGTALRFAPPLLALRFAPPVLALRFAPPVPALLP